MKIDELIARCHKDNTMEEWKQLLRDMEIFMEEDHPVEEKTKLAPLGWMEMVSMICDADE